MSRSVCGPYLRDLRVQRQLSRTLLQQLLEVDGPTYAAIEAGQQLLALTEIQRLARVLHAPELLEAACAPWGAEPTYRPPAA